MERSARDRHPLGWMLGLGALGAVIGFVQGFLDLPDESWRYPPELAARVAEDWMLRIEVTGAHGEALIGAGIGIVAGAIVSRTFGPVVFALVGAVGGLVGGALVMGAATGHPFGAMIGGFIGVMVGGVGGLIWGMARLASGHAERPRRSLESRLADAFDGPTDGMTSGAAFGLAVGGAIGVTRMIAGELLEAFFLVVVLVAVGAIAGALVGWGRRKRRAPSAG